MEETRSTITMVKRRIHVDSRMDAKALLLEHFPGSQTGQLIIHYHCGQPHWIEWQERVDQVHQKLAKVS